jgi:uncharacterized Zn-finger protein
LQFFLVKPKAKKILYNCGACQKKFLLQSDLLQHLVDVHNQKTQFGCVVCQEKFNSLTECETHVLSQHKNNKPSSSSVVTQSTGSGNKNDGNGNDAAKSLRQWPFFCKLCLLRFSTLDVLQKHLKSEDHFLTVKHGAKKHCPEERLVN